MASGLAAGLAEGLSNGLQLYNQNRYYNGLNDYRDERIRVQEEALAAKAAKAQDSGKGGKGTGDYEGFDNSLAPIFKAGAAASPAAQQPPAQPLAGSSPTTLPNAELLTGNPAAAYQTGGLAAPAQAPTQAAPAEPESAINPRQEIVKQMFFGNLANEPDKLNAIAAAAAMHGLGDKITPWLEGLYKAKKTGVFDAAMSLKQGDIDGAMNNLKRGGITLEDRPVRVNPDNNDKWKINISGSGEQTIDLNDLAASSLDPEKYAKNVNDTRESIGKRNVSDAQVTNLQASAEKNKSMAKAYGSGGLGAGRRPGATGALAPTVRKTLETDQGYVAVMSDGTRRILADDNGKPLYGTSGQKTAAGLIGKTLNQYGDNGDIAGKVNTLAGQLQGGRPQTPARMNTLPEGAKQIGTANGKPVYEVNGKRFIPE